jgi:hypothetical protein
MAITGSDSILNSNTYGLVRNLAGASITRLTSSGTTTVQPPLVNDGTIAVNGGTLELASTSQQGGGLVAQPSTVFRVAAPLTIAGGVLSGGGTFDADVVNSGGTVSPGSSPGAATLTIDGQYTQQPGGTLAIDIAGLTAGTGYDRLAVTGATSLDGALLITTLFPAPDASEYTILTAPSTNGGFATLSGAQFAGGHYDLFQDADRTRLRAVSDVVVAPPPVSAPEPQPEPRPLQPHLGETIVVAPEAGIVRVKRPGSVGFITLEAGREVPVGSTIDATHGRVSLAAATNTTGGVQRGSFFDGRFVVKQLGTNQGLTELRLSGPSCSASGSRATTSAKRKRKRRLWGDAKGHFKTSGNYASAITTGTRWLTEDTCRGTRFRVTRGTILTRRKGTSRQFAVSAGHSRLFRPLRKRQ